MSTLFDLPPRRRFPTRNKLGALALHAPLMILGTGDDRRVIVDHERALASLARKYGQLPGRLVGFYLAQADAWLDNRLGVREALLHPETNGGWTICAMWADEPWTKETT